MVEEYYAYGEVDKYSFGGAEFSSASFEIFKKFAIMHFAADIRAAHQLPPLNVPAVTDAHPGFSGSSELSVGDRVLVGGCG